MSDTNVKNPVAQSETSAKNGKRYKGYDLDKMTGQNARPKPWFWKILGISLVISAAIVAGACAYLLHSNQQTTNYISQINSANTIDTLLDGHENVKILISYSNLAEEDDYTTTRFVKMANSGDYYCYFKTEGTEDDYKEVIHNQKLYRYDEQFVYFYGLLDSDYEDVCVISINDGIYQVSESESIESQIESGDFVKIEAVYTVTEGDTYTSLYGLSAGDEVEQSLTLDKDTMVVLTAVESYNDEEIFSYTVEYDGDNKKPQFYKDLQSEDTDRVVTVYYDYEGDDEELYTFEIQSGVYFTLLDHDGYTVYMDAACETEFTEYQMEMQNAESELTLYVKKDS
ncbi:MAG: hypothetical protein LUF92_08965 [Clostridiales bacterium]|nr:hypothetical protein [Clostridiales bacterium]